MCKEAPKMEMKEFDKIIELSNQFLPKEKNTITKSIFRDSILSISEP